MNNACIEPIRLADSNGSLLEACHDWWRNEGGVVDAKSDRMQKLFSHIQFTRDDPAAWPPPFLRVGTETNLAFLFGPGFVKPAVDIVTISLTAHWGPVRCSYERLVLPAKLKNGKSLFLTSTHMRCILSLVGDNGRIVERDV